MVIAPFITSEGTGTPYVTIEEVLFSPTASGIDFNNLIENASDAVQRRALQELIVRASAKADNYVMGALGTLSATQSTENGRFRPNRDGNIIVHPEFWPILEVVSFSAGALPGQGQQNIPLTTNNCFIERHQFIVTAATGLGSITSIGSLDMVGGAYNYRQENFCQYQYVNGFANGFLSANASSGATSFAVTNVLGMYLGQTLTIWDGMNDENVTISTINGSTLTLTSPLKYAHAPGVNISALPATVKQAVIHFVVAMVKQRGQGGLVISEIGEATNYTSKDVSGLTDNAQGMELLDDFRQIWGRI